MMVEITWRDTGFLVSEFSLLFISRLRVVGREGECSSCSWWSSLCEGEGGVLLNGDYGGQRRSFFFLFPMI